MQNSAVTTLSARLVRNGLVERYPSPRDGRATCLRLTSDGERAVQAALPRLNAFNASLAGDFSAEELAVVSRFLRLTAASAR